MIREFLKFSLNAALGRSTTYSNEATDPMKNEFRECFRNILKCLGKQYKEKVEEAEHIKNIECICDTLSDKHAATLRNGRLRVGIAQKALNLYLKYLWRCGCIKEPPHCPLDSVVLKMLKRELRQAGERWTPIKSKWTEINEMREYMDWIKKIEEVVNECSIAQWELKAFNKERDKFRSSKKGGH